MPLASMSAVPSWQQADPIWLLRKHNRRACEQRLKAHQEKVAHMVSCTDRSQPHRMPPRAKPQAPEYHVENLRLVRAITDIAKRSYERQVLIHTGGSTKESLSMQLSTRSTCPPMLSLLGSKSSVQSSSGSNGPIRKETQRSLDLENVRLVRRLAHTKPSDDILQSCSTEAFEQSRKYLKLAGRLRVELQAPRHRLASMTSTAMATLGTGPKDERTSQRASNVPNLLRVTQELKHAMGDDEEFMGLVDMLNDGAAPRSPKGKGKGKNGGAPTRPGPPHVPERPEAPEDDAPSDESVEIKGDIFGAPRRERTPEEKADHDGSQSSVDLGGASRSRSSSPRRSRSSSPRSSRSSSSRSRSRQPAPDARSEKSIVSAVSSAAYSADFDED